MIEFLRNIRTLPIDLFNFLSSYVEKVIDLEKQIDDFPVGFFGNRMAAGTPVNIYVYGDSTHFGYLAGGGTASPGPVQTCQVALRSYYNNTAATFTNKSVSGMGTSYGLSIWSGEMASIAANSIVWISYGTNDSTGLVPSETKTVDQYAANLRTLVLDARKAGHTPIFETSLPLLPYGDFGTYERMETLKFFAKAMRSVAQELNVPLLDTNKHFERMFNSLNSPLPLIVDGIHLTQLGYNLRGYWMANMFMLGPEAPVSGVIKAIHPSFKEYGGSRGTYASAGSAVYYSEVAQTIKIPINIAEPGTDVYIGVGLWEFGAEILTVKSNGVTIYTGTLQSDFLLASAFPVDSELKILENAAPGFYYIEISASAGDCALYYLLFQPTTAFNMPTIGEFTNKRNYGDFSFTTAPAPPSALNHILTNIQTSSSLSNVTIEFSAAFDNNQGVFLYGSNISSSSRPWGGCLVYLDGTAGHLAVGIGAATSYDIDIIGAVDLRNVLHKYKIVGRTDDTVEIYVDNVLIQSISMTIPYHSGRFGLYTYGEDTTVEIFDLKVS